VIGATITAATSANGVLLVPSRDRRLHLHLPYKYRLPRSPALLGLADRSPTKYLYLAASPRLLGNLRSLAERSTWTRERSLCGARNESATSVTSVTRRGQRTGATTIGDSRVPRFSAIRNGTISSIPPDSLVIRSANGSIRAYARPSISGPALDRPPFDNCRADRLSNQPSSRVMAGSRAFGAASASPIAGRGQGRGDRERRR